MSVDPSTERRFAWLVVLMFFIGGVINYINRAALGVVMPEIRHDLSLTNTDYGIAVNSFLVAYGIFYIVGGWVADRLGSRRAYPLMVACWSVANMLHGSVHGLPSLCAFRALLGIAEGGYFPAAIRGATEWLPPASRGKAIAVYFCGSSLGSLCAPPLVAWTTLGFGWRGAFVATGGLGLLIIPCWLILQQRIYCAYGRRDPAPAFAIEDNEGSMQIDDISLSEILRRRKYWLILISRALCDSVWFFYLFWIPGYFQEIRGFSLKWIGKFLWVPYLIADSGALLGAWVSDSLIKRGHSIDHSRKGVLVVSAMLCILGSTACFAAHTVLALCLVSMALFGALSFGASINTVITEITPRRYVALLFGITGASGTILAAISQPIIGHAVDTVGYNFVFVGSGVAFALALMLLMLAGRVELIQRTE